jgi:hypothetical protein
VVTESSLICHDIVQALSHWKFSVFYLSLFPFLCFLAIFSLFHVFSLTLLYLFSPLFVSLNLGPHFQYFYSQFSTFLSFLSFVSLLSFLCLMCFPQLCFTCFLLSLFPSILFLISNTFILSFLPFSLSFLLFPCYLFFVSCVFLNFALLVSSSLCFPQSWSSFPILLFTFRNFLVLLKSLCQISTTRFVISYMSVGNRSVKSNK